MKKPTAVEWLLEQMELEQLPFLPIEVTNKAKDMEKNQLHRFYIEGYSDGKNEENKAWNETFKSK